VYDPPEEPGTPGNEKKNTVMTTQEWKGESTQIGKGKNKRKEEYDIHPIDSHGQRTKARLGRLGGGKR